MPITYKISNYYYRSDINCLGLQPGVPNRADGRGHKAEICKKKYFQVLSKGTGTPILLTYFLNLVTNFCPLPSALLNKPLRLQNPRNIFPQNIELKIDDASWLKTVKIGHLMGEWNDRHLKAVILGIHHRQTHAVHAY